MTTPDFEEWLMREDIPVEHTTDVDDYIEHLENVYGIHNGSLEVARDIYAKKYKFLEELGIHPFERKYEIAGEIYTETRFGITELRGSWGAERMYEIAIERAEERMWWNAKEWLEERRRREFGG